MTCPPVHLSGRGGGQAGPFRRLGRVPRRVGARSAAPRPRAVAGFLLVCLLAAPPCLAQRPAEIDAVRSALAAGKPQQALASAEELVALYPDSPRALLWLGNALLAAGRRGAAAAAYLRARSLAPEDVEVLLAIAELRQQTGDLPGAAAAAERAAEAAPTDPRTWRVAGNVRMQMDEYATAAGHFERALELAPEDVETGNLLGVAYYLNQQHDAAIAALERVLARDPDYLPAVYSLGVVLADRPAEHERALGLLRRAAEGGWEVVDAHYLIGRIESDRGNYQAAAAALEKALEHNPEHLDANYRLAQAYARLGDADKAREYADRFRRLQQAFNEAEARDKRLRTLRNELTAALRDGDLEAARRLVDELLSVDPEDPDAFLRAAKVWISAGDLAAATDAVVAALQIDPDQWEALYLRGLLLLRSGHAELALEAFRRSLQGNPLFAETYAGMGNALSALGRLREAIDAYAAAIEIEPDNPGYHLNLAAAYGQLGEHEREQEILARYRRLIRQQPHEHR